MKISLCRAQIFCFVTCVISAITQRTSWLHSSAFFFHTMWPRSSPPPTLACYLDISPMFACAHNGKIALRSKSISLQIAFFFLSTSCCTFHDSSTTAPWTAEWETITAQNKANENSATRRAAHKIEVSRGSCTSYTSMLTDVNALYIFLFLPCTKN